MQVDFSKIKFDEKGLIPAIVQDAATNAVLMLAYMNGESLAKTVETGYTWFGVAAVRSCGTKALAAAMCRRSSVLIMIVMVTVCW